MNFSTFDGSTVTVRRSGHLFDLELKNVRGETTASVEMSSDDAAALMDEIGTELYR